MNNSIKINFNGGYINVFITDPPVYKFDKWEVKILGNINASNETTKADGKRILLQKGFTTNGNKTNEFYKIVTFCWD